MLQRTVTSHRLFQNTIKIKETLVCEGVELNGARTDEH